jgi:hypothetical protein
MSEPGAVRDRRQVLSAGGRRVEAHHLEHGAAVGGTSHHDLDRHDFKTDDRSIASPLQTGLAAVGGSCGHA